MTPAASLAPSASDRFYASGLGDRLVDERRYPTGIQEFLSAEKKLLIALRPMFTTLVEVGCMDGRHVDWASAHKKNYLGVEPVSRYAVAARRAIRCASLDPARYRVLENTAEHLDEILAERVRPRERCLVFFPFNSFGNAQHPARILGALARTGRPVLISSYRTTRLATRIRRGYYERCAYRSLRQEISTECTRFVTDDGLSSAAYRPRFLARLAAASGLDLIPIRFGQIGLAFASPSVARRLTGP
ncbi:MAG: hypothetical protein DMF95_24815 [Acidobacteria bacterium]|nr:MAG: hypothetical protein DMF95_24815 [Acidobacteriota bacterium]